MKLVDSHCHIQDSAFDTDREEVLDRALSALAWLVVVGDDLETSRHATTLTGDRVFAAVGVHPYHAECIAVETMKDLGQLAAAPKVVAIGEIGLDYFKYCSTPKEVQQNALEQQLGLACELNLPVVIHNREASDDVVAIVKSFKGEVRGVMHCFSGDEAFAAVCLELGFHISFAGNVTYPKAQNLRNAAATVPMDRLLVETDSPYLAPQPVRGKRCEPANVLHTAEALANLKDLSVEEFAQQTTQNAARLFGVTVDA